MERQRNIKQIGFAFTSCFVFLFFLAECLAVAFREDAKPLGACLLYLSLRLLRLHIEQFKEWAGPCDLTKVLQGQK
jgi:hypothetical protein